jgi:putative redox protein
MKASVTWQDGTSFTGTADSGFTLETGTNAAGNKIGSSPMELLLISLAGCTAMDVISILQKKRQAVTDFQVQVEGDRAEDHPKLYTHLRVHYVVRGRDISPEAVERAIALSTDKYCSVSAMLNKAAVMEHSYEIIADDTPA